MKTVIIKSEADNVYSPDEVFIANTDSQAIRFICDDSGIESEDELSEFELDINGTTCRVWEINNYFYTVHYNPQILS